MQRNATHGNDPEDEIRPQHVHQDVNDIHVRIETGRDERSVAVNRLLRKTDGIFEPFVYKNDHFAKTGSGQTEGNLKKRCRFPHRRSRIDAIAVCHRL
jgi:hypothetical protein